MNVICDKALQNFLYKDSTSEIVNKINRNYGINKTEMFAYANIIKQRKRLEKVIEIN